MSMVTYTYGRELSLECVVLERIFSFLLEERELSLNPGENYLPFAGRENYLSLEHRYRDLSLFAGEENCLSLEHHYRELSLFAGGENCLSTLQRIVSRIMHGL